MLYCNVVYDLNLFSQEPTYWVMTNCAECKRRNWTSAKQNPASVHSWTDCSENRLVWDTMTKRKLWLKWQNWQLWKQVCFHVGLGRRAMLGHPWVGRGEIIADGIMLATVANTEMHNLGALQSKTSLSVLCSASEQIVKCTYSKTSFCPAGLWCCFI